MTSQATIAAWLAAARSYDPQEEWEWHGDAQEIVGGDCTSVLWHIACEGAVRRERGCYLQEMDCATPDELPMVMNAMDAAEAAINESFLQCEAAP